MIKSFFLKHRVIIFFLIFALLIRLPWLYTTVHKDEGQIGYVAWRWLSGENLYTELNDNKPPLLYMIYSIPILLFGNTIIPIRILSNILFLVSIVFFFKLVENTVSKKIALLSTSFYTVFMSIPVFEGYFALSEIFLTPFLIASVYSLEKYFFIKKPYLLFIASILASISVLIKHQAIFIFLFIASTLLIYEKKNKLRKIVSVILIPVVVLLFLFMFYRENFLSFLNINWLTFKSPIGFASGYKHYSFNLTIFLEGSLLFLFSITGLIKAFKSENKKTNLFFLWLVPALLFTLAPPAYGRYYLFLIPPLAVFSGVGFDHLVKNYKNKKVLLLLAVILFIITCILVIKQFPNSNMDTNHFKYRWAILDSYDQQKELAEYVKRTTDPTDEIFVFGWEPSVYWMSERTPPKSLGFSYRSTMSNWTYLEPVLTGKKYLRLVIFLHDYTFLTGSNDFFSNEKKIYGATIYELKTKTDYCYFILACKDRDKSLCKLILTPVYNHMCSAILNTKEDSCYKIKTPPARDECLFLVAVEKQDLNICNMIKNKDLFTFCTSRLRKEFDYAACISLFSSQYNEEYAVSRCTRDYARYKNDTQECNRITSLDEALFCKTVTSQDKTYCENISNDLLRAYCMAYSTSDERYCP